MCNSGYWWYLESQGTDWEKNLDDYRGLESQTLTIHEPIHIIFEDYSLGGVSGPEYTIQESFSKGLSLNATGIFPGYNHEFYTGNGQYSLENPPPEEDSTIYNFLIYSTILRH